MQEFRKKGCLLYRFLEYIEICSKAVRNCMKDEFKNAAQKRNQVFLKVADWQQGIQGETKIIQENEKNVQ
jgi:hypothetical protein